jgi:hypothetical protein
VPTATATATIVVPFVVGVDIRDVQLVGEPLAVRWATVALANAYGIQPLDPRFGIQPLPERYSVDPLAARWITKPEES